MHSLRNYGRGRPVEHPHFINRFPHFSTSLLPNGYRDEIRTYFECSVNFLCVYICTVFGATALVARVRVRTHTTHARTYACMRACIVRACIVRACVHACVRACARAAGHRTSNVDYRGERMSTRRATSRAPYMVHRKMISIHRNRRSRASAAAAPASCDARTNRSAESMIQRDSK